MFKIENVIDKCKNQPSHARSLDKLTYQVWHRCDVGKDAVETAKFFGHNPQYTGGTMAYHFYITEGGVVQQAVPLLKIAPGAIGYNRTGVQIALKGDFRKSDPTVQQYASALELATWLYELGVNKVMGHTEKAGTSADPKKVCPGAMFPLEEIRGHVKRWAGSALAGNILNEFQHIGAVF